MASSNRVSETSLVSHSEKISLSNNYFNKTSLGPHSEKVNLTKEDFHKQNFNKLDSLTVGIALEIFQYWKLKQLKCKILFNAIRSLCPYEIKLTDISIHSKVERYATKRRKIYQKVLRSEFENKIFYIEKDEAVVTETQHEQELKKIRDDLVANQKYSMKLEKEKEQIKSELEQQTLKSEAYLEMTANYKSQNISLQERVEQLEQMYVKDTRNLEKVITKLKRECHLLTNKMMKQKAMSFQHHKAIKNNEKIKKFKKNVIQLHDKREELAVENNDKNLMQTNENNVIKDMKE